MCAFWLRRCTCTCGEFGGTPVYGPRPGAPGIAQPFKPYLEGTVEGRLPEPAPEEHQPVSPALLQHCTTGSRRFGRRSINGERRFGTRYFLDSSRYWGFTPGLCRRYRVQIQGNVASRSSSLGGGVLHSVTQRTRRSRTMQGRFRRRACQRRFKTAVPALTGVVYWRAGPAMLFPICRTVAFAAYWVRRCWTASRGAKS